MPELKLQYLSRYTDQNGKARCYLKHPKARRQIPLKSEFGTPEFVREYFEAVLKVTAGQGRSGK